MLPVRPWWAAPGDTMNEGLLIALGVGWLLSPAVLAGTWSMSGIVEYYSSHPSHILFNLIGLGVALIAVQGKLEKVPFDIPDLSRPIGAIHRRNKPVTPAVARFIELLREDQFPVHPSS